MPDKYLTDVWNCQYKSKIKSDVINEVVSPMGSGKTTLISKLFNESDDRFIVIAPLRSNREEYEQNGAVYSNQVATIPENPVSFTYATNFVDHVKVAINKKIGMYLEREYGQVLFVDVVNAVLSDVINTICDDYLSNYKVLIDEGDYILHTLKLSNDIEYNATNWSEYKHKIINYKNEKFRVSRYSSLYVVSMFLNRLVQRTTVISFSATFFDKDIMIKYGLTTNRIVVSNISTSIQYNSVGVYLCKSLGIYNATLYHNVKKAISYDKKVLVYVNVFSMEDVRSVCRVATVNNKKALFICRPENNNAVTGISGDGEYFLLHLSGDNKITVDHNLCYTYVGCFYANISSAKHYDGDVFKYFDIVCVNTSTSRHYSITSNIHEPHYNGINPLVISCVSRNHYLMSSHTQVTGRLRKIPVDVLFLFTSPKDEENNYENNIKYVKSQLEGIIYKIDYFISYYYKEYKDITSKLLHIDSSKGMNIGRFVGKAKGKGKGKLVGKAIGKAVSQDQQMKRDRAIKVYDEMVKDTNLKLSKDYLEKVYAHHDYSYDTLKGMANRVLNDKLPKWAIRTLE